MCICPKLIRHYRSIEMPHMVTGWIFQPEPLCDLSQVWLEPFGWFGLPVIAKCTA